MLLAGLPVSVSYSFICFKILHWDKELGVSVIWILNEKLVNSDVVCFMSTTTIGLS